MVSSSPVTCQRSGRLPRLQHVGGQFTVLDGNVSEVSSMGSTVRSWSHVVRSASPSSLPKIRVAPFTFSLLCSSPCTRAGHLPPTGSLTSRPMTLRSSPLWETLRVYLSQVLVPWFTLKEPTADGESAASLAVIVSVSLCFFSIRFREGVQ